MNLPVQTLFSQLKPHPTPVFPSVAYVMVQLGLEQIPQAHRFIDAMCGAGNIALMVTQVLKDKFNVFVGGFDKDSTWIEIARENSQILKSSQIEFYVFDLLAENFESSFPFFDYDILFAHPPYSHFVQYSNEVLEHLYRNLLQIFQKFSREKACLVINSPRSDILVPLISEFPFMIVQTIEIPRKTTTIKLWVLIRKQL
jgi:23S rRNA G2445 N2-methylase RlmL